MICVLPKYQCVLCTLYSVTFPSPVKKIYTGRILIRRDSSPRPLSFYRKLFYLISYKHLIKHGWHHQVILELYSQNYVVVVFNLMYTTCLYGSLGCTFCIFKLSVHLSWSAILLLPTGVFGPCCLVFCNVFVFIVIIQPLPGVYKERSQLLFILENSPGCDLCYFV